MTQDDPMADAILELLPQHMRQRLTWERSRFVGVIVGLNSEITKLRAIIHRVAEHGLRHTEYGDKLRAPCGWVTGAGRCTCGADDLVREVETTDGEAEAVTP